MATLKRILLAATVASGSVLGCAPTPSEREVDERPNILLIVADDLGFSDIGVFGGEIRTPNLDALAAESMMLTSFYTASACSPTRAMLLSGMDHHLAGLGSMNRTWAPNQEGQPGYEGVLNQRVVSMATLLKDAGYLTAMVGKWHLGMDENSRPLARGFDHAFASASGSSHFADEAGFVEGFEPFHTDDGERAELPEDFYTTRHYTDKLIDYIDASSDSNQPLFAYAAYTAPHWPLQVPDDYLDLYDGVYDEGYDVLRARRRERVRELGLVAGIDDGPPRLGSVPAWESLSAEARRIEARKMEIYAAMVERLDHHIGRLLEHLEQRGELDNTFILFFSDNGAEGNNVATLRDGQAWVRERFDHSYENMGKVDSYLFPGAGWAQASAAPFNYFKQFVHEGGIRVPTLVRLPGVDHGGQIREQPMTVQDVLPTVLEVAGVEPPGTNYQGREVHPIQGVSALPYFTGAADSVHGAEPVLAWELFGRRAVRRGPWKIVSVGPPLGDDGWKLFNLDEDPAESNDLAAAEPETVRELQALWDAYARDHGVVLPSRPTAPMLP